MDIHTKTQRSFNMSRIHTKNTKPEIAMFNLLDRFSLPFECHFEITGKPDIAFPEYKVAVFIDGEYWHGKLFNEWKNQLNNFWMQKISSNIRRDRIIRRELKLSGWRVVRIWGKEVIKNPAKSLKKITQAIKQVQETH